jgi:chromosome condensin MukBEF MukE localization factor
MADCAREAGVDVRAGVDDRLAAAPVVRGGEPTEYDAVVAVDER